MQWSVSATSYWDLGRGLRLADRRLDPFSSVFPPFFLDYVNNTDRYTEVISTASLQSEWIIEQYKYIQYKRTKYKYKYKQIHKTLLKLNRKSADEMNYWAVTEVNHATRPVQCYHSCTRMSRGFGEHPKHKIPRQRPGSIGSLFFRNVRDLSKITLSSQNCFFTLW